MTTKKVFVTGAAGQTGLNTLKWLSQEGSTLDVYAGVHKADQPRQEAKIRPFNVKSSVIEGHEPANLAESFRDIQDLFVIPPATDDKVEIACNCIKAAKEARVKFVLLLSVVGAEKEGFTWGDQFMRIEKYLRENGPESWCILRTNYYAQNLMLLAEPLRGGELQLPTGEGRFAPIDVEDLGYAARCILRDWSTYRWKTLNLTGPMAMNGAEMAQTFATALNRPIAFRDVSPSEARQLLERQNVPEVEIRALLDFYALAKSNHFAEVTNDYAKICGKEPKSLLNFIEAHKSDF